MRIKYFLFFSSMFLFNAVNGQDSSLTEKPIIKYWNSFATGILSGGDNKTLTASLSTTHGIAMHRWRLGVGVGIEGYDGWRTVPIFGSISFDFGKIKNNALYIQTNAGYAFGHRLEKIEGVINEKDEGGLMLNPMLGYRMESERFNVSIAAGYKLQQTEYSFEWGGWWPYVTTDMTEDFNRFTLQIGVGFH